MDNQNEIAISDDIPEIPVDILPDEQEFYFVAHKALNGQRIFLSSPMMSRDEAMASTWYNTDYEKKIVKIKINSNLF